MSELTLNDGGKLFYQTTGLATNQPIIMLHGFSGRHVEFDGQVNAFVSAGYQVIQVDLRNHGRSSYDAGATISRLSADIQELIISLDLTDVILMAHSMGAAVTWSYCQLFGIERLHAIVTIDESPQCLATNNWPYSLFGTTWSTIPNVMEHFKATKMTVTRLPDRTFKTIKDEQKLYPFDIEGNKSLLSNHVSLKWQSVIERLTLPQLYIAGGQSPLWSSEHAKFSALLTNFGEAVIIPETGHLPHAEKPEAFNEAVLTFLNANK